MSSNLMNGASAGYTLKRQPLCNISLTVVDRRYDLANGKTDNPVSDVLELIGSINKIFRRFDNAKLS